MKTLIVAEKPSVGKDIASALAANQFFENKKTYLESDDYIISWSIGHLFSLAQPEKYDKRWKRWSKNNLPMLPKPFLLETPRGSKNISEQRRTLKRLMTSKDVGDIINACDAGREGELIFAYLYQWSGSKKPVNRLWLSSMTDAAIHKAFDNIKPGSDYKDLEDAARSRAEADWLVGMNATQAATLQFSRLKLKTVSLGRVQTPTLAILAAREKAIQEFVPEDYWVVEADLFRTEDFKGFYLNNKKIDSEAADTVVAKCSGLEGTVVEKKETAVTEKVPMLFDLTSLQREAGSRFGYTAKRTLGIAQSLYESKKVLTYPRTSSRFLTDDLLPSIQEVARDAKAGIQIDETLKDGMFARIDSAIPKKFPQVFDESRVGDHHAIIPTGKTADLDAAEQNVYDLVLRRTLAVFQEPAEAKRTKLIVEIKNEESYLFHTVGKVYTSLGWRAFYTDGVKENILPPIEKGDTIENKGIESIKKTTAPPKRDSDASLLAAMETSGKDLDDEELREAMKDSGIGTPATRASIIERLLDVEYLEREGKSLRVTEKGMIVIDLISGSNTSKLCSPELTGDWEHKLLRMERSEESRADFDKEVRDYTKSIVDDMLQIEPPKEMVEKAQEKKVLGPCPNCGKQLIQNSRAFSCWSKDDPGCGFSLWTKVSGKNLPEEVIQELYRKGKTAEPVKGFRSKKGRSFDARLKLEFDSVAKKTVIGFDEDWAKPKEAEKKEK